MVDAGTGWIPVTAIGKGASSPVRCGRLGAAASETDGSVAAKLWVAGPLARRRLP